MLLEAQYHVLCEVLCQVRVEIECIIKAHELLVHESTTGVETHAQTVTTTALFAIQCTVLRDQYQIRAKAIVNPQQDGASECWKNLLKCAT